jgi:hypothetical protein
MLNHQMCLILNEFEYLQSSNSIPTNNKRRLSSLNPSYASYTHFFLNLCNTYEFCSEPLHYLYFHREFEFPNFNLSHSVERLKFGLKLSTATTPLDSVLVVQQNHFPMHYHYGITGTGIVFESDGVPLEMGYEYGVVATASIASSDTLLTPGLYFQYALTPYAIRVAYLSKPISGWMTSTFGILGGGFAIALMLDGLFYGEKSQRVID